MEYQKECEICGDAFVPNGRQKKRCKKEHFRACAHCGNDFKITPNMKTTAMFCSASCRGQSTKRVNICPVCGTKFEKRSKTCSLDCEVKLREKTYSEKTKERKCELCENKFTPINASQKYCSNVHSIGCEMCGNKFEISDPMSRRKYCSTKCASFVINGESALKKRRETSMKNYGTESPQSTDELKKKIVESNVQQYGVEHAMKLKEFQDKAIKTNLEKYGVEYSILNPDVKAKAEQTNMERYGSKNPWGSPDIQKKINKTFMDRYGFEWANTSDTVKDKRAATNLAKYGVENVMMLSETVLKSQETFAQSVNSGKVKHRKVSQLNVNFTEMLKTRLGDSVQSVEFESSFGDNNYQADLKINDSILIDINPSISHNSLRSFACVINGCGNDCTKHSPVKKSYHFSRARAAMKEKLTLIQFYDWDDEDFIVRILKSKLDKSFTKLSARGLDCRRIAQNEANLFLIENHVQGRTKDQLYCYGLFDGDEMLAVATFGKSRFNDNYEYEFIRYAVKDNYIVHGGAGKMFKKFVKDAEPQSVINYVDFNRTTGETFANSLDFEEISPTGPSLMFYSIKEKKRVANTSILKVGIDTVLGTNYGTFEESGMKNGEIMIREGYLPIYVAGSRVFVWER